MFWIYITKYGQKTFNPSVKKCINKTENRILFIIKTGYYLEVFTLETMRLLGSNKSTAAKDENGENVSHLEITETVLVHCNFVNNNYQQKSRVLYAFVPNKLFGQLLDILHANFNLLKTFDSEFSYIELHV